MPPQLLSREAFKQAVFKRDHYQCVMCGAPAVDAHHIIERHLWGDGGYYLENGASVCAEHHLQCESTEISVTTLREKCGIQTIWQPPHLYNEYLYDKWGNPLIPDSKRLKGELFQQDNVQKILQQGRVLDQFIDQYLYPKTPYFQYSNGTSTPDFYLPFQLLNQQNIVITEYFSPFVVSFYSETLQADALQSLSTEVNQVLQHYWSTKANSIPQGWRVCCEILNTLPLQLKGLNIWNEMNECLSVVETLDYFELLEIPTAAILYQGVLSTSTPLINSANPAHYRIRVAESYAYSEHRFKAAWF